MNEQTKKLNLTAIEELINEASPGPWLLPIDDCGVVRRGHAIVALTKDADRSIFDKIGGHELYVAFEKYTIPIVYEGYGNHNMKFIAESREIMPALVARVRELEKACETAMLFLDEYDRLHFAIDNDFPVMKGESIVALKNILDGDSHITSNNMDEILVYAKEPEWTPTATMLKEFSFQLDRIPRKRMDEVNRAFKRYNDGEISRMRLTELLHELRDTSL